MGLLSGRSLLLRRRSRRDVALGAVVVLVIAFCVYAFAPRSIDDVHGGTGGSSTAGADPESEAGSPVITSGQSLQRQIIEALAATRWPPLKPSIGRVANGPLFDPALQRCPSHVGLIAEQSKCEWGSPSAPTRVVLVGDSVAQGYAGPLSEIATNSQGGIWFLDQAMGSCSFTSGLIDRAPTPANCDAWKNHVVDVINSIKPDAVIISNQFTAERFVGSDHYLTPTEWADSLRPMVDRIRGAATVIAFLAYPPGWMDPKACLNPAPKPPVDCIGKVTSAWTDPAAAEQELARQVGAVWVDSRPWFCSAEGLCPSFVGTTPTKRDIVHMAPEYGQAIYPVIAESLTAAGVL